MLYFFFRWVEILSKHWLRTPTIDIPMCAYAFLLFIVRDKWFTYAAHNTHLHYTITYNSMKGLYLHSNKSLLLQDRNAKIINQNNALQQILQPNQFQTIAILQWFWSDFHVFCAFAAKMALNNYMKFTNYTEKPHIYAQISMEINQRDDWNNDCRCRYSNNTHRHWKNTTLKR